MGDCDPPSMHFLQPCGLFWLPSAQALTFELINGETKAQGSSYSPQVAQRAGKRKRDWPLLLSESHSCGPPAEEIRGLFKPDLPQENASIRGLRQEKLWFTASISWERQCRRMGWI